MGKKIPRIPDCSGSGSEVTRRVRAATWTCLDRRCTRFPSSSLTLTPSQRVVEALDPALSAEISVLIRKRSDVSVLVFVPSAARANRAISSIDDFCLKQASHLSCSVYGFCGIPHPPTKTLLRLIIIFQKKHPSNVSET